MVHKNSADASRVCRWQSATCLPLELSYKAEGFRGRYFVGVAGSTTKLHQIHHSFHQTYLDFSPSSPHGFTRFTTTFHQAYHKASPRLHQIYHDSSQLFARFTTTFHQICHSCSPDLSQRFNNLDQPRALLFATVGKNPCISLKSIHLSKNCTFLAGSTRDTGAFNDFFYKNLTFSSGAGTGDCHAHGPRKPN